jgi:hypothetical protein
MRISMHRLVAMFAVLFVITMAAFGDDKKNMVTDQPSSTVAFDISTITQNYSYLHDLTGWTGDTVGEINATNDLKTFGDGLCDKFSGLCTPADTDCAKDDACNPDGKKCLTTHGCKITRNIYIIHLVDWKADDKGKISLITSKWALYQSDEKGKYKTIYPDADSFPNLWDVDNGVVISVSRLLITRGQNNEIIPAQANLSTPDIEYTITNTEKKQLWLAGLETLISGLAGPTFDARAATGAQQSSYITRIRIVAVSAKKLSRPVDIAVAANATGTGPGQGQCDNLTSLAKCTFSNDFNVLSRDYIAFGINIVPHGPAEATYTAGTATPSITNHNAFYGVVDFTLFPKKYPMTKYPYAQAGLPLSGAATHLPYVGAAYPIPIPWLRDHFSLSAFAGTVFMKQQGPGPTPDRAVKLLWGFEVPIASFTGAISQVTGK